jgi:hypothetical protein
MAAIESRQRSAPPWDDALAVEYETICAMILNKDKDSQDFCKKGSAWRRENRIVPRHLAEDGEALWLEKAAMVEAQPHPEEQQRKPQHLSHYLRPGSCYKSSTV